ncbi:MAG: hypothetical protein JST16_10230 [Bdellovibrionales bacterium]|nr:hypothetical protein [Bdellovibrionales bacterium]
MKLLPKILVGVLLATVGWSRSAAAYAEYIGYGHSSCLQCHFNAYGGGPVNNYARAVDAAAISAQPFFALTASDEVLARNSNFLGSVEMPEWFQPQLSYRGIGQGDAWQNERLDFSLSSKPARFLWASVTAGYNADPVASGYPRTHFVSREHYLAIQPWREFRLYAGFMDVIYGLRLDTRNAVSRARLGLGENDQTHGVVAHYATSKLDAGLQAFLGNVALPDQERTRGAAVSAEYEFAERVRFGASGYYGTQNESSRWMGGLFTRVGSTFGSSLLAELGFVRGQLAGESQSELGNYLYIQTTNRLTRGLHWLFTSEYFSEQAFGPSVRQFRIAPGLQYLPFQRLELRVDLRFTRWFGAPRVESDDVDLLSKVALWF